MNRWYLFHEGEQVSVHSDPTCTPYSCTKVYEEGQNFVESWFGRAKGTTVCTNSKGEFRQSCWLLLRFGVSWPPIITKQPRTTRRHPLSPLGAAHSLHSLRLGIFTLVSLPPSPSLAPSKPFLAPSVFFRSLLVTSAPSLVPSAPSLFQNQDGWTQQPVWKESCNGGKTSCSKTFWCFGTKQKRIFRRNSLFGKKT